MCIRDRDIFFIQPCCEPVNEHLVELILYLDAFRRASAHSVSVVIPYFPYARQERMAKGREAVSYTHLRAHETVLDLVCRLLLAKKQNTQTLDLSSSW